MLRLSAITVFAVKSLRGQPYADREVEPWGLVGDRRYVVLDAAGRFLSQRDCPAMATLDAVADRDNLRLAGEGQPTLHLPHPGPDAERLEARVWDDRVAARAAGAAADQWFTTALGRPCRLAYMDAPHEARPTDPDFSQPGDHVSFADGFPLLIATTASLDDLNHRLPAPIGMDRFRPNLVVEGAAPWSEDDWRRLRIGSVMFEAVKPCARCIVTTIDQRTGRRDAGIEPIRTLQGFRRDRKGQVLFGQNLVSRSRGRIAVGDAVEILA